jgi:hypothetical protein
MNIFSKYIDEGRVKTQEELRKQFRILAKRLHPDASTLDESGALFIRLKRDFEAAKAELSKPVPDSPLPRIVSREEFYQAFWELEASSFPVDGRIRKASKTYTRRVAEFAKLLDGLDKPPDCSFSDVERELYELRDRGIIDNPLFGRIRMIFYNLITWHLEPRKFTRQALEKWMGEIDGELEGLGMGATRSFLLWLIRDMDRGPALADE